MNLFSIGRLSVGITPDLVTIGISFGLPYFDTGEWYIHFGIFLISWGQVEE